MDSTRIEWKDSKNINILKQSSVLLKVIQKFKLKKAIISRTNNNSPILEKAINHSQQVKSSLNQKFKEFNKILINNSSKDILKINLKILIKIFMLIIIMITKELITKLNRRV